MHHTTGQTLVAELRHVISSGLRLTAFPVLAALVPLVLFGTDLVSPSVPVNGDVRAHVFKIAYLYNSLLQGSWPSWIPFWYQGFPLFQYYPPTFYLAGAALTPILGSPVAAYKAMMAFCLLTNGLAAQFFLRRIAHLPWRYIVPWQLTYQCSVGLLLNYAFGAGPNLLAWSLTLVFLALYGQHRGQDSVRSGLGLGALLGVVILIHPFPAIFAVAVVGTWTLLQITWIRDNHPMIVRHLRGCALLLVTMAVVSIGYWVPFITTRPFVSPISEGIANFWPDGIPWLLSLTAVTAILAIVRRRAQGDRYLGTYLLVCWIVALILGSGITTRLPGGFGDLLHSFRFAMIVAPFFSIAIIANGSLHPLSHPRRSHVAVLVLISLSAYLLAFVVEMMSNASLPMSAADTAAEIGATLDSTYLWLSLAKNTAESMLWVPVLTVAIGLLWHVSRQNQHQHTERALAAAQIVSLALVFSLTVLLPLTSTATRSRLTTLVQRSDIPLSKEYSDLLESGIDGRLLVSSRLGHLTDGDAPVTFAWQYGVQTVTGPYNQGDPNFFDFTVHVEWEDRWLDLVTPRQNLMIESGTSHLFVHPDEIASLVPSGLTLSAETSCGQLWRLDGAVSQATAVTPILLVSDHADEVADLFNIAMPGGFRFAFVDARTATAEQASRMPIVMVDDPQYLLTNQNNLLVVLHDCWPEDSNTILEMSSEREWHLTFPLSELAGRLFFQGENADPRGWREFDTRLDAQMSARDVEALDNLALALTPLVGLLDFNGVPTVRQSDDEIAIESSGNEFVLLRESFFPYWHSSAGTVIRTTQGFMLLDTTQGTTTLRYVQPLLLSASRGITTAAVVLAVAATVVSVRTKSRWTAGASRS